MKKITIAVLAVVGSLALTACAPAEARDINERRQDARQDARVDHRVDNRHNNRYGVHPRHRHVHYIGAGVRFPLLRLAQFHNFVVGGVPYYVHPRNNTVYVIDNGMYYPVADPRVGRNNNTTVIIVK